MRKYLLILISFLLLADISAQGVQLAVLKYRGGGDWYANLETSLPNLIRFCNKELGMSIEDDQAIVEASNEEIFNYPFIHMTGHGNVVFSPIELENLRTYMLGGGFLHIDDNYGMDQFIRIQLEKIFPDKELIELPPNHPIFNKVYSFPKGLPKIHEHDNKEPKAFGIFHKSRLVCLYTYESDLGDGWEDISVHNDSERKHNEALKMGANILSYIFSGEEPSQNTP